MGRDVDKERIDIMLENNFYGLTDKQLEAWIAKARAKAKAETKPKTKTKAAN
jgi:hypothetical protein